MSTITYSGIAESDFDQLVGNPSYLSEIIISRSVFVNTN